MPAKKKVEVDPADEMPVEVEVEAEAEVEMTEDPPEEEIPEIVDPSKEKEVDELAEWVEKSKQIDAARKAEETKKVKNAEAALAVDIETKVAEQYPDSYRVTDWAGHKNYECNKCGFADLDKFKLYAHLIQAHSGIEYDYRGETTHS